MSSQVFVVILQAFKAKIDNLGHNTGQITE